MCLICAEYTTEEDRVCVCVCLLFRDWTQEGRIKKTVDAWISTLNKDIQVSCILEDLEFQEETVCLCFITNLKLSET